MRTSQFIPVIILGIVAISVSLLVYNFYTEDKIEIIDNSPSYLQPDPTYFEDDLQNLIPHNNTWDDKKEDGTQLQIKKVLDQCNNESRVQINILYKFSNSTHYIDGHTCEWEIDWRLVDILDRCKQIKETGSFGGFAYGSTWKNETHQIDNTSCKWGLRK